MRKLIMVAGMVAMAACQSDEAPARSELTKRQADSAIGASGLPGAGGITRSMSAADSADARNARLDSMAAEP